MNIQELLRKSQILFDNKQYQLAKEHLQAVLEQNQNSVDALLLLAQCDEALGRTKAMASSLFRILSIDTSNLQALEKLRNTGFLKKEHNDDESELEEKILDDGSVYLLQVQNNTIDGFGAVFKKDGFFYAGMFKNGVPNGHGMMRATSGIIYVGNINGGNFDGEGTMITDDYQLKSTFRDAKPDGKTPIEIKWRNGNRVVACIDSSNWEDIYKWSNIKYYKDDGICYQIDLSKGDSINIETGEILMRNDNGYRGHDSVRTTDIRYSNWEDSVQTVKRSEKSTLIFERKKGKPIPQKRIYDYVRSDSNALGSCNDNILIYKDVLWGISVYISYFFRDDRLWRIEYLFKPESLISSQDYITLYQQIVEELKKKYGDPTSNDDCDWDVVHAANVLIPNIGSDVSNETYWSVSRLLEDNYGKDIVGLGKALDLGFVSFEFYWFEPHTTFVSLKKESDKMELSISHHKLPEK